jgi:hypothetical protein
MVASFSVVPMKKGATPGEKSGAISAVGALHQIRSSTSASSPGSEEARPRIGGEGETSSVFSNRYAVVDTHNKDFASIMTLGS